MRKIDLSGETCRLFVCKIQINSVSLGKILVMSSILGILFGSLFILLYTITIIGLIIVIIAENRNPLKTIPWVIVLLLVPGIGLIFYFFFGQDNRKKRIISRRTYKRIINRPKMERIEDPYAIAPETYKKLATLLNRSKTAPLLYAERIQIYTNGKDKFKDLLDDIRQAKHHIHLQYYIFCDDEIGREFQQLLIKKAHEGVQVRVIYDDVGCWNVKDKFFHEMKQNGIEIYPFLKVAFPVFTSKVNYRNHRKVVVIDGKIGYMGGMNVADRYWKGVSWGVWRDLHFRITGKAVYGLQTAFLIDWYVVSKQVLTSKIYYPALPVQTALLMQILTSGPVSPWRTLTQAYIYIITNAKQYVYIQTPYFLPTEGLNQALQVAARGGVDVRIMLPEHSDTQMANLASRSFLAEMIRAGVKIYFYQEGFLHSKLLLSDDYVTCIGSANMDFRSLEHNFEINAFVYQRDFAIQMKKIFMHDSEHSRRITPRVWLKRPLRKRFSESFMRLFSPLL